MQRPRYLWLAMFAVAAALAAGPSCSGYSSMTGFSLPTHDVTIVQGAQTMGAGAFSPNPFTVSLGAGGKVVWANGDYTSNSYGGINGTTHTITSDTPGIFDSGSVTPGTTFSHTFTGTGTFTYHCSIHPTMAGTIVVTP